MRLVAYDLALDLVRSLRPTLAVVKRNHANLGKQMLDALSSIPLNINEATSRIGGDRATEMVCALGSLREVTAVLDTAEALGWIVEPPFAAERNRLGGLLWGLQRR